MAKARTKEKDSAEILRQHDLNDLKGKLDSARKALFELKIKRSEQKNPLKIKWARHSVARILTIIKEKTGGTAEKTNKKIREGIVISDKMSKTVVVEVARKVRHPLYQKVMNCPTLSRLTMKARSAPWGTGSR